MSKNFISLFFFILVFQIGKSCVAQINYFHYLDSTVAWSTEFSNSFGGNTYYQFDHYSTTGDTLLGGIWYWNITDNGYNNTNGNITNFSYSHFMGLREDSAKRFYRYEFVGTHHYDSLWFDFNIELGDTIYADQSGTFFATADILDSVMFDGYKHYLWRSQVYYYQIGEGIGSVYNGYPNAFITCWQKDTSVFGNQPCTYVSGIKEEPDLNIINISPNPAENLLNLLGEKLFDNSVSIMDLSGRIIEVKNEKSPNKIVIDISTLLNGIYFLRVKFVGGGYTVKKFVKQ
ncbi:MAG: T9SS type A sorting domain-containing protein [Bacteroidota bacterium]